MAIRVGAIILLIAVAVSYYFFSPGLTEQDPKDSINNSVNKSSPEIETISTPPSALQKQGGVASKALLQDEEPTYLEPPLASPLVREGAETSEGLNNKPDKESSASDRPKISPSPRQQGPINTKSIKSSIASVDRFSPRSLERLISTVKDQSKMTLLRWNALEKLRKIEPDLAQKELDALSPGDPLKLREKLQNTVRRKKSEEKR